MSIAILEDQKGKVDKESLLGRLLWYFMPDVMLDYDHVVASLQNAGFTQQLPKQPQDRNTFLRVTKDAERKIPHDLDPMKTENYMVRDITTKDESKIVRRLVMELRDPQGKELSYEQLLDFIYDRDTKHVSYEWYSYHDELSDPIAEEIRLNVAAEYAKWRGMLTSYTMREWLRKTILSMGAVPAKASGGIYFIEERYASQIEALEQFVADMIPDGGECHSVEIPDNSKQREMVRRAIINETVGELERKMTEIDKIRQAGKLTPVAFMDMMADVETTAKKLKQYEKLLEADLEDITARVELMRFQAQALSPLQKKAERKKKTQDEEVSS